MSNSDGGMSSDTEDRICGVEGRSLRGYVYVKVLNAGVEGGRSVRQTMPWPDLESEGKMGDVGITREFEAETVAL